jgi:acyl dehydratase
MMIDKSTTDHDVETPVSLGYDRIRFTAPVYINDTVTVRYRIAEVDEEKRQSRSEITVTNQHGETVTVGQHLMRWVKNE